MGDGASILVTKDPWLPVDGLSMVTTNLEDAYKEVRAKELFQPGTQQWDRDLNSNLFNPRDREVILNMPLSLKCTADQWYWTVDDMGLIQLRVVITSSIFMWMKIELYRHCCGRYPSP